MFLPRREVDSQRIGCQAGAVLLVISFSCCFTIGKINRE